MAGQWPFIGAGVNRQRFSRMPENNCIPSMPKSTIMKSKKITTFPKSGREDIND